LNITINPTFPRDVALASYFPDKIFLFGDGIESN